MIVAWLFGGLISCGRDCPSSTAEESCWDGDACRCAHSDVDRAIQCCLESGGTGGVDDNANPVPAGAISRQAAGCAASVQGLSTTGTECTAGFDDHPTVNYRDAWFIRRVLYDPCTAEGVPGDVQAELFVIDGQSGVLLASFVQYITVVIC